MPALILALLAFAALLMLCVYLTLRILRKSRDFQASLTADRSCAACGAAMPHFRKPANARQMLLGGWTCPQCGTALDRRGRVLARSR